MDKKGFTLVELLAVIVLLAIVMTLVIPSVKGIYESNNNKVYTNYEKLMVEYTKTIPKYKDRAYICLSELGMETIDNLTCNGYVTTTDLKAYLRCLNTNNQELYKTNSYDTSKCN